MIVLQNTVPWRLVLYCTDNGRPNPDILYLKPDNIADIRLLSERQCSAKAGKLSCSGKIGRISYSATTISTESLVRAASSSKVPLLTGRTL